jgi:hypothetical protein
MTCTGEVRCLVKVTSRTANPEAQAYVLRTQALECWCSTVFLKLKQIVKRYM